jgi:hypothetical protein
MRGLETTTPAGRHGPWGGGGEQGRDRGARGVTASTAAGVYPFQFDRLRGRVVMG